MLISCTVTAQLICAFVFANAKSRFSHDAAHISSLYYLNFQLLACLRSVAALALLSLTWLKTLFAQHPNDCYSTLFAQSDYADQLNISKPTLNWHH